MNLSADTSRTCQLCGSSVPEERLQAIPDVRTCVACQRRYELLGRAPAPPDTPDEREAVQVHSMVPLKE